MTVAHRHPILTALVVLAILFVLSYVLSSFGFSSSSGGVGPITH